MQVRVLGQVEAVDGAGAVIALGGPTLRRVLAALAMRRNEVVSVPYLIDVVWPEHDVPKRAEHNIRTYIHRLRGALGVDGERLETVGAGYRLQLADDDLDAARFERLAGTAARLESTGDPVGALDAIGEADRLWHGRPFEEFAHENWAVAEAARLTELRLATRTLRAEALLAAARATDAVVALERLVRDEPLRERPRALLMRALYESGRQAEALRAFQEFRRSLVEEIGVEPSGDLVALDRAIAGGALPAVGTATRSVGGYDLHERIGEGASSVVHRATQRSLGREVAIKIIRAELANRPEFIRRFEAEARMVARIEHPHVVPLYDYWREPDRAFLVMRWMTGGSLRARLDDRPWTIEATAVLIEQVAAALDAAHEQGVVHRDVKPENILIDEAGHAFLGDFGIALDAEARSEPGAALSEGSPLFAAPEQLRHEEVGPEADVHALAIVAYTMLVGRTPFADAPDEPTLLQRQLHDPISRARPHVPELPEAIDAVLAIATSKDPSDRYPTIAGFEAAFRRAAGGDAPRSDRPPATRPRANPYKGLRAFDETDAIDFFGRERLVDELVDHLATEARMVAVVGPSGSGKSSVVRAGLVPALRDGAVPGSAGWYVTTLAPGSRPFEALETALLRIAVNPPAALLDQLHDGDRGVLRAVKRIVPNDDGVVAIVVDQFEELFTGSVTDDVRDRFLRGLSTAVSEPASPVRLLITVRADFYDRPLRHLEFARLLKAHTVVVTPLAPDELERAIVTPAEAVGVAFEPGLVAEILADVNDEPGALPLLQFALTRAFDAIDDDTITVDAYRSIGGLTGALGRRAEELYRSAATDEQVATHRLFGRLVTLGEGTEDTRRRSRRTELGRDPSTEAVLDRFGQARLLTFDHDPASREPTVEIAHEALIREWPRLRSWLDEDRDGLRIHRHLTETAAAWIASGRDDGELYRGGRLETAEGLVVAGRMTLNPTEDDFLSASLERRDETARSDLRRTRRLRRLVGLTALVAAVALSASAFAVVQARRASAERDARDLVRLRAEAIAVAERIPAAGILLAIEADRADPSVFTKDALHRTLTSPSPRVAFPGISDGVSNRLEEVVALTDHHVELLARPEAELYLALRDGGDIMLTTVATDRGAAEVTRHVRTGSRWESAPTGRSALVAGSGEFTLWVDDQITVTGPDERRTEFAMPTPDDLVAFAISDRGDVVVLVRADGSLDVYRADGVRLGSLRLPHERGLADGRVRIAMSEDGSLLSVQVNGDREDGSWLLATTNPFEMVGSGTTSNTLDILSKPFQRPFVGGRGVYVAPPQTNYVYPVDPSTGVVDGARMVGHSGTITDVVDEDRTGIVATASVDGTVRVWERASGRPLGREILADTAEIRFDGQSRLVVPHHDHISIWNYDTDTWREIGCVAAQRNLTREEWEEHGPRAVGYRRTCEQYPIERSGGGDSTAASRSGDRVGPDRAPRRRH